MEKKEKSKKYFTQEHEDAILEFVNSTDQKLRNKLFTTIIRPALSEMVQKIVYKYKFTSLPNIESLIPECEGHLITVLSKYDKERNSKAFSYFSVITRNWFFHKSKKYSQQTKKEIICDDISKSVEVEYLSTENQYISERTYNEFIKQLWVEIGNWETLNLKPNERKMIEAIKILLNHQDSIEIFNKKAVFLYCREITGLNTKQILTSLQKFRQLYKDFRKKWDNE